MDNKEFNLRKDWDSIETVISVPLKSGEVKTLLYEKKYH